MNMDRRIFQQGFPDVRDGLTHVERVLLHVLRETRKEMRGRDVPTAMLYGRILEHMDISEAELNLYLVRLGVQGQR